MPGAVPDAVIPRSTRVIELDVRGMTCAACAVRVERKLNKLDQVVATVNFATERARVTAPADVGLPVLIGAVEQAGYTATATVPPGETVAAESAAEPDPAPETPDLAPDPGRARVDDLRRRLILALIFFVPLSDLSVQLSLFPSYRFPGWQWVLVALAAPVAGWAAWPFHAAALRQARHRGVSMDTLVSLGVTASVAWSVYAMFVLDSGRHVAALHLLTHGAGGGVYLEVAAAVTTFLLAGRFYEARARHSAAQAMRELASVGAKRACRLATDGTETWIPVTSLRPGDMIVVRPGETIAADGEVLFGQSAIDRSMMTGESVPADAGEGDQVTGGTVALTGRLVVRAGQVGRDTQLAHLIRLVADAQAEKAAIQRLADRASAVFVPCVLALAAGTLALWLALGAAPSRAFSAGLAVLIIACPCALGLATPAALVVACGRGARLGIFIKGHQALESSRVVGTVLLDKTGTVTTGRMSLAAVCTAPGTDRAELLRYAGAVEQASEHAVAAAISVAAAAEHGGALPRADRFAALPGLGARGTVDGQEILVGREAVFRERGLPVPADLARRCADWQAAGHTAVLAGWGGAVRGAFAVTDTVKESAAPAVAALRGLGLRPVLLTGDSEATARVVAARIGVTDVIAGVLPAAKAAVVRDLRAGGHAVAMVGDGVNDAPALAAADLGLAVGSGTDVAISAADIILLREDLRVVPDAIRLARGTFRTIRQNLCWAFGYNLAAIPLAAAGFLNPLIAAATMALSSVFVVWNSLRLRKFAVTVPTGPPRAAPRRATATEPA